MLTAKSDMAISDLTSLVMKAVRITGAVLLIAAMAMALRAFCRST